MGYNHVSCGLAAVMIPDPLTFAQQALGCRFASQLGPMCATHAADSWPCPEATRLAALIEARDREIRADECEEIAKAVWAAERATQHRGDTNGEAVVSNA